MADDKPVVQNAEAPVVQPQIAPAATNGLAIASMVVGIVAFISGWAPFWGVLVGAAAVVLGILGLKKSSGKGLAITGIITGGLALLTSLLFTALFIIGIATSGSLINEAQNQIQQDTAEAEDMSKAKKDFAKGDTAVFDNLEVKVNSVERNFTPTSGFAPDEGNEYIVVNLTVKNIGDESETVSDYIFSLNESGITNSASYVSAAPDFKSGELTTGASTTGNIVYEVTKGATDLKIQYDVTLYTGYDTKDYTYTLAI